MSTVGEYDKKSPQIGQALKFLIRTSGNSENPESQALKFLISELDLRASMGA